MQRMVVTALRMRRLGLICSLRVGGVDIAIMVDGGVRVVGGGVPEGI